MVYTKMAQFLKGVFSLQTTLDFGYLNKWHLFIRRIDALGR